MGSPLPGLPERRRITAPVAVVALAVVLAVAVTVAVTLVVTGGRRSGLRVGAVSATVTDAGLQLRHPAGAALSVPPGALPTGATVTLRASRAAELSRLGALQPDGLAWDIHSDAEPTSPVTFSLPYDPAEVPAGARPMVATFEETSGWWIPVDGQADPAARRLTAQLPSFSLKTWILDRVTDAGNAVVGAASWLEYQGGRLLGNRAGKPTCGERPAWVREVITVEDDNAQLFACAQGAGDGFAINMTNNRGYPVAVEFDTPFTSAGGSALDDGLAGLLERVAAATGGTRAFLLATGSGTASFDPVPTATGHVEGHVRHEPAAMVVMLAAEALRIAKWDLPTPTGKKLGIWTLDCVLRTIDSTGKLIAGDVAAAGAGVTSCLQDTLGGEVRQWGFDPGRDLWSNKAADRLPVDARRAVSALRWLHGVAVAKWSLTAADLLINDRGAAADLVDVAVHWREAPVVSDRGSVWLYTVTPTVEAIGTSGRQVAGRLGGRAFPNSTGAWVGCDGTPATMTYRLDNGYRRLDATVGLSPATPAGISARMTFTVDGVPAATVDVTRDSATPVTLALAGATRLVVATEKTAGDCGASPTPYGVLGDATLHPGSPAAVAALPAGFAGTWRGTFTQPGSDPEQYPMELVLTSGPVGTNIGTVTYSALACGGTVTLAAASAQAFQLTERIESGSRCTPVVDLRIRRIDDRQVAVSAYRPADTDADACCWGVLTRA